MNIFDKVGLKNKIYLVLAPMAGITNGPFRLICEELGADICYSEMVSDKGLIYDNERTKTYLSILEAEKNVVIQVFGSEVTSVTKAAKYINDNTRCLWVDINSGCPVQKIVKSGSGSALMKTPDLAYEIVKSVKNKISKPVSIKIRMGWDFDNLNGVEYAKLMEKAGIDLICVHARTRSMMYTGKAYWDFIRLVKANVSVPVFANGDIINGETAKKVLEITNCDGLMIGRGAIGNPWIFQQIKHFLRTGENLPLPSVEERKIIFLKHYNLLISLKGEIIATKEIRAFVSGYFKGISNACFIRQKFCQAKIF